MKSLNRKSPIWHAVAWIAIYVGLVNAGDWISAPIGGPNWVTPAILVAFSIGLLTYVAKNGWRKYYGLGPLRRTSFSGVWLYIPLAIIIALQYFKGLNENLDLTGVLLIVALMICVGFLEELLFRGFLFRAILAQGNLTRAVIISGVTFGVGHIVNLARGYTGTEQILQIAFGVVLGIVLALLFAVTGTILPLIAFHTLFNISGNLTAVNNEYNFWMLLITAAISLVYGAFLVSRLRRSGAAASIRATALP